MFRKGFVRVKGADTPFAVKVGSEVSVTFTHRLYLDENYHTCTVVEKPKHARVKAHLVIPFINVARISVDGERHWVRKGSAIKIEHHSIFREKYVYAYLTYPLYLNVLDVSR